jgi:hypothetical protein
LLNFKPLIIAPAVIYNLTRGKKNTIRIEWMFNSRGNLPLRFLSFLRNPLRLIFFAAGVSLSGRKEVPAAAADLDEEHAGRHPAAQDIERRPLAVMKLLVPTYAGWAFIRGTPPV